ncbi:hypothetical protein J5X98_13755 [Leptothermofonsia sichuanensis E412]|uniref:hypothetical protein n=1 Tax=Leptothermofonsia sichuanensis TaxID=2917832 RepID=UPI001CA71A43|nr:hypothetical protein [Leptothermofonsia sichuanensis]QZZ18562.1 hypothetical protein J5X98_13755 [Leptothermofonsia sichuanensis E412]
MFKFVTKAIKYYLLGVFGFTVACWLAGIVGIMPWINPLMPMFGEWIFRLLALILCLMATAAVVESVRQ